MNPFNEEPGARESHNGKTRYSAWLLVIVLMLLGIIAAGCANGPSDAGIPSSLDPRGPAAGSIAFLWWVLLALGTVAFVIVGALLVYIAFSRRRRRNEDGTLIDEARGRRWILWGGVVLPLVLLPVAYFFNLRSLSGLSMDGQTPAVTIDVEGHRWWWEVRYADEDVVTANEIHIPVGQPVQLRLTSADVIHSFWVPQLHGKMDMNPGDVNTITVQADEPGEYRGICAEFCGAQHARMAFVVVASTPDEFEQWLEQQRQPAPEPADDVTFRGQQVFLGSACVYCHTVRGTNASGEVGPDLTHLQSRRTLAAGTLENNRGNLAGWIVDPQHIKPGNLMPPTQLSADDMQPLLEYLDTLE